MHEAAAEGRLSGLKRNRLFFAALAVALLAVFAVGLKVRVELWRHTTRVRFDDDIRNGMRWGGRVLSYAHELSGVPIKRPRKLTFGQFWAGYVGVYDNVVDATNPHDPRHLDRFTPQYRLDYAPLRLLTMSWWMRGVRRTDRKIVDSKGYRDELAIPLLRFNKIMELASCGAMLLLVYHWLRQEGRGWRASLVLGCVSASLLWLNAALLLDAHAWPQWDVWCLPFYLFAAYFASLGASFGRPWGWWAAGLCLALGAMFKGQILLAAPVVLLWPIFLGRPLAALAVFGGVACGVAATTWPWLLTGLGTLWAGGVVLAAAALCYWRPRGRVAQVLAATAVVGVALWSAPWMRSSAGWLLAALLAAGVLLVPRRAKSASAKSLWLACLAGVCVLVAGGWLGGSWAWFQVAFLYPTDKFRMMAGGSAFNFPQVLANFYGWEILDDVPLTWIGWVPGIDPAGTIPIKRLLTILGGTGIFLCAVAVAWQSRRRDSRVLMALAAPWVVGFALMPQMHERYLLWGACATAAAVAVGPAGLLIHLAVTAASAAMIWHYLLDQQPYFSPQMYAVLSGVQPGFGWAVVVLAGCCLTVALTPGRRRVTSSHAPPRPDDQLPGTDGA